MLAALPSELLDLVISQISSRGDLKRLCEVCTHLHNVAIPHLYRSLILSASEFSLEDLVVILETIPRKYLKYTQEFGFSIPVHERVASRCVHHGASGLDIEEAALQDGFFESLTSDENMDDEETDDGANKGDMMDLFVNLNCALDSLRFPDDQLKSFRWEVGTCIPEAFFCGNDSLLRNQRQIQSISFITDGECIANKDERHSVDLVQFSELRSLDWRGLNRYRDFESVRECVKYHGHQIRTLSLDLLTWLRAEKIWVDGFREQSAQPRRTPDNFFSQRVLEVYPQDQRVVFESLENLHLSAVSFDDIGMEMVYAFNIEQLKSLKLRNCPGSLDWLRLIVNSTTAMKLKSVELALDLSSLPRDASTHITETICNFICSVFALESIFLMLPEPFDWTTLTHRLSDHRDLKRFVMHHLVDRGGQNLIDGDVPWSSHLEHILQGMHLTCFGSSIPPVELASRLREIRPRPACKLIHVRTSGVVLDRLIGSGKPSWFSASLYTYKYGEDLPSRFDEIHDFAQWAFSADGLPKLQVLAWGDFSYQGRYSKYNLLLCKSESGYRTLNPSDEMAWNLVQDNMDMLAACPLDNILE